MDYNKETNELFRVGRLVLLVGYTILVCMHITITFLLGWEKWILLPILVGLGASWGMHFKGFPDPHRRLYFICGFMMVTYFIYGTHPTSTYDLGIVMTAIIMLFTMAGDRNLITICQITFYITMTYDLALAAINGQVFDVLLICRIAMNYAVVTLLGIISRTTIDKWYTVVRSSEAEIKELSEASVRLNDFLANVSHELRTPVNAIIGLSNICIDKETSPEIKKDMTEIHSAGRRIADQIGDILDYSEIDRGSAVVNTEDYMLSSMVNDLVVELKEMMPENLELVLDVSPEIPSMMNSDVTKLKRIIKALISNGIKYTEEGGVYVRLVSEKREYGVNLILEVTDTGIGMTSEELEKVYERYYQSDSGRSRATNGLGLGLGIVYGFVTLLGGFMNITSTVGEGTKVRVSIPQTVVDDTPCMAVERNSEIRAGLLLEVNKFKVPKVRDFYNSQAVNIARGLRVTMHRATDVQTLERMSDDLTHLFVGESEYIENKNLMEKLARKMVVVVMAGRSFTLPQSSYAKIAEKPVYSFTIAKLLGSNRMEVKNGNVHMRLDGVTALVVDDEPMNLVVAKSIFKRYGMVVSTAASGAESIEMCRNQRYDIIFMDHMMSGMDGVEAMKRIRHDTKGICTDVPCVALTANAMSSARQMFMSEGFDGFVSKPIDIEEMERVLKKLIPDGLISYEEEVEPDVTDISDKSASEKNVASEGSTASEKKAEGIYDKAEEFLKIDIDVDKGMEYSAGDEEFYRDLLLQYSGDMKEKIDKLIIFYGKENWTDYEIIVHALKSTSKMIGNDILSEKALNMEKAAHDGDSEFIKEHHEDIVESCKNIRSGIFELLGVTVEDSDDDSEVLEFGADDEALEFEASEEEALEFEASDDEVLEFEASGIDPAETENQKDEIFEFEPSGEEQRKAEPEEDVLEFEPLSEESDDES